MKLHIIAAAITFTAMGSSVSAQVKSLSNGGSTTRSPFETLRSEPQNSAAQGRIYHQWICNKDGLDCDFAVYYCWQSDEDGGCIEL